jgi:hypothetical protein
MILSRVSGSPPTDNRARFRGVRSGLFSPLERRFLTLG